MESILRVIGTPGQPPGESATSRSRLRRAMVGALAEHRLIADGDRVLVAVSGGKDSFTLADLLWEVRKRAPFRFDLVAFHLDQGQPGHDPRPLREWFERAGIPLVVEREDTYSAVLAVAERDPGTSYCRVCSRLRRGILYAAAGKIGCNVVALGHHRDDALQTFLLNLLYAGRLQAMPAGYRTLDERFRVIRPLVACGEDEIAAHAARSGYPILPCNLCGSIPDTKRRAVAALLARLEGEIPDVRQVMLAALGNVRPTHLLDAEVAEAWGAAANRFAPRR